MICRLRLCRKEECYIGRVPDQMSQLLGERGQIRASLYEMQ